MQKNVPIATRAYLPMGSARMTTNKEQSHTEAVHCHPQRRIDWLLWSSVTVTAISYVLFLLFEERLLPFNIPFVFLQAIFELINRMWWGLLLGILFVGLLTKMPREMLYAVLGDGRKLSGIVRATIAGVLLDLCSHGILVVGMQLYKRGASLGQTMAFLIASPWNSLSLTLILFALIGIKGTLLLIVLSMIIAIISGAIFNALVRAKILPQNPQTITDAQPYNLRKALRARRAPIRFSKKNIVSFCATAFRESRMVLRWILFGVVIAAAVRAIFPPEAFQTLFGPTVRGIGLTLLIATILEVCSEGSTPIAADIFTRANAPGNAFAFLMAGVSTDYTEIASLKATTTSWKIALFLPLVTLPQIVIVAFLLN